jgi:hypothetical protein
MTVFSVALLITVQNYWRTGPFQLPVLEPQEQPEQAHSQVQGQIQPQVEGLAQQGHWRELQWSQERYCRGVSWLKLGPRTIR